MEERILRPTTEARDLAATVAHGFALERVVLSRTSHVEWVATLRRA